MKMQRLFIALSIVNLGLLIFLLAQIRRVEADNVAPVLRGRQLEIVDEQGRVRASIKLHPADRTYKMPDGKTGYPETVMFRLIDSKGRPEVKLGATEEGGALRLVGGFDSTQVLLQAEGTDSSLKLANKDGRQQVIKP
jgi:hypothetical protein